MKKEVWMVTVLVLVATVSAALLGFVNVTTRPIIERNQLRKLRQSVLNSVNVNFDQENLAERFESEIERKEIEGREVFLRYGEDGELSEVAFRISGSGFQGPIEGIIALKPDLETIAGVQILSQQETPGLGGRITEEWFLEQFNGKQVRPELRVVQGGAEERNEVDAITGATRTSKSIEGIVNEGVREMQEEILTEGAMEGFRNE